MTPQLEGYLRSWLETSRKYQLRLGRQFDLSFEDFISLWGERRLQTMEKHIRDGSVTRRMNAENDYGFVLSWKSYAAAQTGIMNKDTAQVCMRSKSKADNRMKKGDKHKDSSRLKISLAKQGKTHSEEHKKAISEALTGKKRGPMSDEHRAKLSASMKAARAARKAAQGGAA